MKQELDLEKQRQLVFGEQPELELVGACKLGDGVVRHDTIERKRFEHHFLKADPKVTFFVPASGSGSRMFKFLFDFLEIPDDDNRGKTERFLNAVESFAFFELLPYDLKLKVRAYDIDLETFASFLLKPEGLGLGSLPKGLIPFHRSRSFILNAFQEQLLQGIKVKESGVRFHFTINEAYSSEINRALQNVISLTGRELDISLSTQDPITDAYAFTSDQEVVKTRSGAPLKRPSGHGALLTNLNGISADVLFIKNIDNLQHESKSHSSIENLRYLGGVLTYLKEAFIAVLESDDPIEKFKELNDTYQFLPNGAELDTMSIEELKAYLLRPIRVCGMVRNEGQPGGGPFWVRNNGVVSKQIVEKAQIKMRGEQYRLMVQSQYFNPVLMAVSTKNIYGTQLDLTQFSDDDKYFIVQKSFEGQVIKFMERPGLWNGSMSEWITVFVEVPSETFTPVKTVLDLLGDSHREF